MIVIRDKEKIEMIKKILKENNIDYVEGKSIDECFFKEEAETFVDNVAYDCILDNEEIKNKVINDVTEKFLETGMYSDSEANRIDVEDICKEYYKDMKVY